MYRSTIGKCKEICKRKKERKKEIKKTVVKNGRMNKMTEDNCRIGYPKSQTWILKVLLVELGESDG